MYRHHFGLHSQPFRIVPNPKLLYASETHDESRARILYGIREGRGFVVVTGGIGLGKTTVLMSVLDEFDSKVRTALIFNPVDTYHQLLRMISHEFGLPDAGMDEVDLLHELNAFLIERLAKGETCVLLIDEAQNLSVQVLECLRTLSNLQTDTSFLLQIVLVGQPELYERLMDPRLVQLRQRVGIWHEIRPLREEESEDYILHRLRVAGAVRPKEIFPPQVCAKVHAWARGVPRVINQVCDTALLIAYGRDAHTVREDHVAEAAHELRLPPPPGGLRSVRRLAHADDTSAPDERSPRRRRWTPALLAVVALAALGALLISVPAVRARLASVRWPWSHAGELSGDSLRDPGGRGRGQVAEAAALPATSLSVGRRTAAVAPSDSARTRPLIETPASGASAASAAAGEPAGAVHVEPTEIAQRRSEAGRWRQQGQLVYSVHVGSFQTLVEAQEFADHLAASAPWPEPLFVEQTSAQPQWYRVLAGAFADAGLARASIARLRDLGLGYGQVTRLSPEARDLVPRAQGSGETGQGGAPGVHG